ncbi:hypothetical protein ACWGH8_05985 [Nonomuraea muscovyensis]|uniref:Asparagine synthase (Glutamine-hydrolyzing) n=1 Tax=Nonomuraea muscovyensis TaxID=1124761 RepID=A0A7X0C4A9_9ACTN|nr:hypothetical protein [Nonomuraea muscovyensis]MBB6347401.1 asparagine synthase (glutamine-hydrolyzing) [Nonomuraea muscovyensis]
MTGRRPARGEGSGGLARGIDVDAVALYLSRPSLALGVYPASPWADGTAAGPPGGFGADTPRDPGVADPRDLGERLQDAVGRAIGAHRTVAVLHDGSVGASALLAAATAAGRALGAEVTVVAADHPGPTGASVAVATQQVIAALGERHRFLLAETTRLPGGAGGAWNPVAPDLAGTPLVRAAEARAARLGATLLLTAEGCDEVLQAGPLPAPSRLRGPRSAGRQLADRWRTEGAAAVLADATSVLGRGARARRLRAGMQVALAPFAAALGDTPRVLPPQRLAHVESWTADWIRRLVECLAGYRDPVRAYVLARTARFAGPLPAAVAAAAAVPRRSPFLDPAFTAWALRLPAGSRYDPRLPAPHLRRSGLLVALVPHAARHALPTTSIPTASPTAAAVADHPLCRALGVLDGAPGPVEAVVAARLAVLEEWLAGAGEVSRPARTAG